MRHRVGRGCALRAGFIASRPRLADVRASDGHIEDRRRAETSERPRQVRTVRFVRSSLRVLDVSQFEPDHFVPAGLELRIEREKAEQEAP